MLKFELDVWVTQQFSSTWTHVIKGSFTDPQSETQGATDLFCYDRNAGIGSFFATVRNGRLNDGTLVTDGLHKVGPNHTFNRRWTHIVNVADKYLHLLFYDADSGVGEFYTTDGHGNLILQKQYSGWRTTWNLIIAVRFGNAKLLFYDPTDGTGEFHSVDKSGNIHLERRNAGWLKSWHSIIPGNFSNGNFDDLLFYDKSRGVGVFYKVDGNIGRTLLREHTNWRTTWQHIVPGQFLLNAPFDGLLFYEENSGHTEFYSTDGHGSISRIDVNVGIQWYHSWQAILDGVFTPNFGLLGTSSLCNYDSRGGTIRSFYFEPAKINTVIDLNGRWSDGSQRNAVVSSSFTSLTIDMSAFNRPAAHGSVIDDTTINATFPDDASYTGKLEPPNTIKWSNGSTWRKV